MGMTFSEQQTLLSELLGDPNVSSEDMFPLARRKAALNRGDIQFCKDSHVVREYVTGTVASNEIDVPSGWLENFTLIIDDDVIDSWRQIDLHQWERYDANSGSDEPYYYLWEFSGTKKMKFLDSAGVNGKTYELYYFRKQITALSDDADESIIPDEYREGPVYWAAYWLLKQIGKEELSALRKNDYGELVGQATLKTEREYKKENRANPDMGSQTNRDIGGYKQGDGGAW